MCQQGKILHHISLSKIYVRLSMCEMSGAQYPHQFETPASSQWQVEAMLFWYDKRVHI